MKKKKKKPLLLWLVGAALAFALIICALVFGPGLRRVDRNTYYGAEEGRVSLLLNTEILPENGLCMDDEYYLPLSMVCERLNSRFYYDQETAQIRYALPEQLLTFSQEEAGYYLDGEWVSEEKPLLILKEGELYLSLSLIEQYTPLSFEILENPDRIWLWTRYDEPVTYCVSEKKVTLREAPSFRGAVVAKEEKSARFVLGEELGEWTYVISEHGEAGYVKTKNLGTPFEEALSSEAFSLPDYTSKSLGEPVVMGWNYIDNVQYGLDSLRHQLSRVEHLNVISPTWLTLSDDAGGIVSRADEEYMKLAHEHGLQVWAMVDNINLPVDSLAIFSSCQARTRLIDSLMAEAEQFGIDGFNLDMESLNEEIAPHYLQFIRELSIRCRKAGLYLSVDNYVPMPYRTYYDLEEQGEIVDYVVVMGYDESYSEPGPNSSLSFVETDIERTMELVPVNKIIQGIPLYTRCWWEKEDGSWGKKTISMEECRELLESCADAEWSEELGCYFGTVTVEEKECKIWFEELTSMEERLALIGEYELAGIAAWRLGLEDPAMWQMIPAYIVR